MADYNGLLLLVFERCSSVEWELALKGNSNRAKWVFNYSLAVAHIDKNPSMYMTVCRDTPRLEWCFDHLANAAACRTVHVCCSSLSSCSATLHPSPGHPEQVLLIACMSLHARMSRNRPGSLAYKLLLTLPVESKEHCIVYT